MWTSKINYLIKLLTTIMFFPRGYILLFQGSLKMKGCLLFLLMTVVCFSQFQWAAGQ